MQAITLPPETTERARDLLLASVSKRSARIYEVTLRQWADYCTENDIPPADLRFENVLAFLENGNLSHTTKRNKLTHLRKFVELLRTFHPDNMALQSVYGQLKALKVQRPETPLAEDGQREARALRPDQVQRLFDAWDDGTLRGKRNQALLAILFYAGLRRFEAAALRWRDIDRAHNQIRIRQAKGGSDQIAAAISEKMYDYLNAWQQHCPGREFVFCGVRRGDRLSTKDKPITGDAVYKIVAETSQRSGVEFAPHDSRRTLATAIRDNGGDVQDIQGVLRHKNPETSLRYMQGRSLQNIVSRNSVDY